VQHDSTLVAFMSALKVFNDLQPPYASAVLVELFNTSGQFLVKVWYRNDSVIDAEPFQLIIPGKCALSSSTSNSCDLFFYSELLSTVSYLLNCLFSIHRHAAFWRAEMRMIIWRCGTLTDRFIVSS